MRSVLRTLGTTDSDAPPWAARITRVRALIAALLVCCLGTARLLSKPPSGFQMVFGGERSRLVWAGSAQTRCPRELPLYIGANELRQNRTSKPAGP